MYRYRVCGEALRSAVPLPELGASLDPGAREVARDAGLSWQCAPGRVPPAASLIHEWRDEDNLWLRISRCRGGYHLAFTAGVSFLIDGRTLIWEAAPAGSPDTIRHLLLDQALPLALSGQGAWVLHGSAVLLDGRAVLFVGDSGQGKSTLAAWLAMQGHRVLADDCLRLDDRGGDIVLRPSYPGLRMWPDAAQHVFAGKLVDMTSVASYTRKLRVATPPGAPDSVPVGRLYVLRKAAGARVAVHDTTAGSVVSLIRHTFRLDIERRSDLSYDFARAAHLVTRGVVRHLEVPRDLDRLRDVERVVIADVTMARDASGRRQRESEGGRCA